MIVNGRALFYSFLISTILFGCSESDTGTAKPVSNPETVIAGDKATLTANTSTFTSDDLTQVDLTFLWEFVSKPAGSQATLTDPVSAYPSFVADFQGRYILKLTIFFQNEHLSENEVEVVAQPQHSSVMKPVNHVASNDSCNACHLTVGDWQNAIIDHDQVAGACYSCHQQQIGHIATPEDCDVCHNTSVWVSGAQKIERVQKLERNIALWETSGISSYKVTYQCSCLMPYEYSVVVVDGVITEAVHVASENAVPETGISGLVTINALFSLVRDAIQAGYRVGVIYNSQYGYPERVVIGDTNDTEYVVTGFEIVPPDTEQNNVVQTDPEFARNLALWETANLDTYRYDYQCPSCSASETMTVMVTGGVITNAYYMSSGVEIFEGLDGLKTVEAIFSLVGDVISSGTEVTIYYDEQYGYPSRMLTGASPGVSTLFMSSVEPVDVQQIAAAQNLLNEKKLLWEQSRLTDYQYSVRVPCYLCPVQPDDYNYVVSGGINPGMYSIEALFATIQKEINRRATDLHIAYDEQYGYPVSIFVDPRAFWSEEQYSISVSGFQIIKVPTQTNTDQATLDENKQLWANYTAPGYNFTYRRTCFCLPQESVFSEIDEGSLVRAYFLPSLDPLSTEQIASRVSIYKLFEYIQDAIDSNAAILNVTYNVDFGYPESIYIDQVENIADDEVTHTVLWFEVTFPLYGI